MGAEQDPRAPWREKAPAMRPCPECGGDGSIYWACDRATGDEQRVTGAVWKRLPLDEERARARWSRFYRVEECPCEVCGGTGEIEDDNPYDYSDETL